MPHVVRELLRAGLGCLLTSPQSLGTQLSASRGVCQFLLTTWALSLNPMLVQYLASLAIFPIGGLSLSSWLQTFSPLTLPPSWLSPPHGVWSACRCRCDPDLGIFCGVHSPAL